MATGRATCPDCGGHGTEDTDDHSECRTCQGTGEIPGEIDALFDWARARSESAGDDELIGRAVATAQNHAKAVQAAIECEGLQEWWGPDSEPMSRLQAAHAFLTMASEADRD